MNDRLSLPRIWASFRGAAPERWAEEVEALHLAGVDGLHLDVMDGSWGGDRCFEPQDIDRLRSYGARCIDVHLLVGDPSPVAAQYLDRGVDRLTFHLEAVEDPGPLLAAIEEGGAVPGLAILPSTPVRALEAWLGRVGVVNPLGVNPRERTPFDPATYARIGELVALRRRGGWSYAIEADGGVWSRTRDALVDAGADELVGGYPIFSAEDYGVAVRELREGRG